MPLSLPGDNEAELLVLAAVFDEELEVLGFNTVGEFQIRVLQRWYVLSLEACGYQAQMH